MKNLSTFNEIAQRGQIYEIVESERFNDVYIVTFTDGSQANCNWDTMAKLCSDGNWCSYAKGAIA